MEQFLELRRVTARRRIFANTLLKLVGNFLHLFYFCLHKVDLALLARHLVKTEIVVDLLGGYIVGKTKLADLLQEILDFHMRELFERFRAVVNHLSRSCLGEGCA